MVAQESDKDAFWASCLFTSPKFYDLLNQLELIWNNYLNMSGVSYKMVLFENQSI